tara:strand:+ start:1265 stop:1426 length:162 start_codon:yes stop_codon:yes gene_type:complete
VEIGIVRGKTNRNRSIATIEMIAAGKAWFFKLNNEHDVDQIVIVLRLSGKRFP